MRRIFIGDIQGCRHELERLLERCDFKPGVDRLHPVGDFVNRGPDSLGVLRLMLEHDGQGVLGNHDVAWLAQRKIKDPALVRWLERQPPVRVLDDAIQIHAGLHPRWKEADLEHLEGDDVEYALNVRYCTAAGRRPKEDWPPPPPPFEPWDNFYRGTKRVVCGHWSRRGLVIKPNMIALDTGCCYGGQLTAWIAEEDRIVQVPSSLPKQFALP